MKERIKVLSISTKKKARKIKKSENSVSLGEFIERYAPGMYTFHDAYACDAIEAVETLRPEIIWINQEASKDYTNLVKEIKRAHPTVAIFMLLHGACDDEQEVMNAYSSCGAYKCCFLPPVIIDTLVHDMYVALNLE